MSDLKDGGDFCESKIRVRVDLEKNEMVSCIIFRLLWIGFSEGFGKDVFFREGVFGWRRRYRSFVRGGKWLEFWV